MPSLIWTPEAIEDVRRLHAFLVPHSHQAAQRAIGAILQGVINLEDNPELGRPVEGMPPEFRDLIIPFGASAYLARYRYDGEQISMVAVRHGREAGFRQI
jgi:plasmid stabilization system protein ParE